MGWLWIPRLEKCGEVLSNEGGYFEVILYGEKVPVWIAEVEVEWITREA